MGTIVLLSCAHLLVYTILKVPEAIRPETLRSFYALAFAIPIVTTSSGLRGILEAHQEFALLMAIRVPLGMFTFAGPLFVFIFSRSMVAVVGALLAARLITCIAHLLACLLKMPELRHRARFEAACLGDVFHLGGWMTISNLISPLLVYMDRFLIGALVSVTAVAYYATPFEMISKLLAVPLAMMGPLFPAFAVSSTQQDHARSSLLLERTVKYTFLIVFPVTLLTVAFAAQVLKLWLGQSFAQHSAPVLQWLAVGVLINCLSVVAAGMVQGYGRPDIAAKFHLLELPFYLFVLGLALRWYGIVGAAVAWTLRVTLDATLLFVAAGWLSRHSFIRWRKLVTPAAAVGLILSISALPFALGIKVPFVGLTLLIFGAAVWSRLSRQERTLILRLGREPGDYPSEPALPRAVTS